MLNMVVTFGGGEDNCSERENEATVNGVRREYVTYVQS